MSGDAVDLGPWGICDLSGMKVRQSDMITQWNGLRVARRFADVRNPQDFLRTLPEDTSVREPRPEGPDVFIGARVTPADL